LLNCSSGRQLSVLSSHWLLSILITVVDFNISKALVSQLDEHAFFWLTVVGLYSEMLGKEIELVSVNAVKHIFFLLILLLSSLPLVLDDFGMELVNFRLQKFELLLLIIVLGDLFEVNAFKSFLLGFMGHDLLLLFDLLLGLYYLLFCYLFLLLFELHLLLLLDLSQVLELVGLICNIVAVPLNVLELEVVIRAFCCEEEFLLVG
jgi:hypothetical protein